MNKKDSKWTKFKEIWANKRYKALIKLGMYALFFVSLFLISYISRACNNITPQPETNNQKTIIDTYIENNYNYTHVIEQIKDDIEQTITYTGIETQASSSGTIAYSNSQTTDKYIIDKVTNSKYINGIEQKTIYEIVDEKYFSLEKINEIIAKSTKQGEKYVYIDEDNISIYITIVEQEETLEIKIEFNEKYISETLNIKNLISTYKIIK